MITGKVNANREAVIELEVAGPVQQLPRIQAIIDTGYNGFLTLPSRLLIATLQLPFVGHRRGALADGSIVLVDVFLATILWHGRRQDVIVAQAGGEPLV